MAVLAAAGILVITRYLPAIDEARLLRANMEQLAGRIRSTGFSVDRPSLDSFERDLSAEHQRFDRLADMVSRDPIIAIARTLPLTQPDARGLDSFMSAAGEVFAAADAGLAIVDRYVAIKAASVSDPVGPSPMSQLVELMATTRDDAIAAQNALLRAKEDITDVPDGPMHAFAGLRDGIDSRLATYGPLLDRYVDVSATLPSILGWEGRRRYLVLTQNPAELRPTGGYTGSYGIVTFDRGRITERTFRDVALLDFPWDFPYVQPPSELTQYLLGPGQPWQFADANWSPDYPTSAQDALRLYTNESDDHEIDGVLAVTTYTIDALLELTGPIEVPEYGATIGSGETTLKALQLTRVARPGENRKAFLSAFADHLLDHLTNLPVDRWDDLVGQLDSFRDQRLLLAWLKDPIAEGSIAEAGYGGAVRQDAGDFLYPVDSNVAPASKINAIATRSLRLDVSIDAYGDAAHTLDVTWDNPIATEVGRPYREIPTLAGMNILGMYFRALTPRNSTIESVSGGSLARVTAPAVVEQEAGRAVFGTYLMIPPGSTTLRYTWTTTRPIETDPDGGYRYRLTIQRQPGQRTGPIDVRIHVPPGFVIQDSPGLGVTDGATATLTTSFDRDIELDVLFASPTAVSPAPDSQPSASRARGLPAPILRTRS